MKKRNRVGFLNILSTCLLYGISIITAPLFSRLLGTGGYGNVSNYNVWVSILSIAATLQTQATLANAMVEFPASEQDKYQSSVLSLSLVCFAVVAALVLLFLGPISNALNLPTFFILLVLFQSFGTYGVNFMNRKLTYEMKAGRNLLLSLVTTLATMGLSLVFVLALPQEQRYYGRITAIAAVYGILGISLCISIWAGKDFLQSGILALLHSPRHSLCFLQPGRPSAWTQRCDHAAADGRRQHQWHLLHCFPAGYGPLYHLHGPEQHLGSLLL